MLNIRINLTINLRKVAASTLAGFIFLAHLVTPAYALTAKVEGLTNEKPVTVKLAHLTVTTTKTQAKQTLASPTVKYFDAQALAFLTVYAQGRSMHEWYCLSSVWIRESHFNPLAHNKGSGAFGIAQFLPSTWGNYKVAKTAEAKLQIQYGLRYIDKRYGSACGAWKFWQKHGWY
jgi:hypothetical protein